ncbi:TonB-dependent siderophore receptor [Aliarcobacter lanthieri]|uniref:TonB-dependent siderophore receptor n=1 Tax=Aliarcobacter lanthieri TaxID=1355374 RepID=UPI00047EAF5C|nr:TonB-dependent receptor [Aliarcobacter lanthieri]QKF60327.1 TonB-dependent siderophore receptor [Aliarcobacter lanthieri]
MNLSRKVVLSTTLSILLSSQLFAQNFSAGGGSLEDAIKEISKQSNMTYMVDSRILEGKKAPNIKNIEGVQNALNELLKGTDLEATIEENTIVIKKVSSVTVVNGTYILDEVSVNSGGYGSSQNGYVSKEISGVGLWDKRSLQDTPYQMSVISQDLIENSASGIPQVFKMNPTVQLNYTSVTGDSWNAIGMYIRGFSVVSNILIDGISFSDAYTSMSQDLERIEILNGLSGFLYGPGNVGGVVNYVSKRPTQERLTNLIVGSTGNQAFYAHADLGGKIDEKGKFSYRLNAFKQDGETSIKDQKVDNTLISGALDWRVTDNLILSFDASHKKSRTDKLTAAFRSNDSIGKLDPKQGYSPDWTYSDTTQDRLGFKSLWYINDNIKLRTGYLYLKKESNGLSQPWIYDNYDGTYESKNYKLFPDEVKNQGAYAYTDFDFDTFGIQHTLTVGASGSKKKIYEMNPQEFISLGNFTLEELNSKPLKPIYAGNPNNPLYLSSNQEKINFMIGDDIKFNDNWGALLGLNYVKIENKNYNKGGLKTGGYDADEITPSMSLIYKPFEDLTTYITYMESLENGLKVNCADCTNNGEVLDPYLSKQYEVGAKYSISENLLLSSALFRIEKALRYDRELPNNMKEVTQDGLEIHEGLELTTTGKITNNLTIVGGGTIMNIEVDKTANPAIKGKKPIHAASKMAKLYAEYNLPFLQGLTLTGGAYYTGKSYRNNINTDIIPSYTIYDAGLRYKTKIDKFPTTFLVNATNVTNKKYWRTSTSFGEPTNLAFSMKMEF